MPYTPGKWGSIGAQLGGSLGKGKGKGKKGEQKPYREGGEKLDLPEAPDAGEGGELSNLQKDTEGEAFQQSMQALTEREESKKREEETRGIQTAIVYHGPGKRFS